MRVRTTRRLTKISVAVVTAALTIGLASPTLADSDKDRKKALDARIQALKGDLDETSASLQKAVIALETAQAQLPDAEEAVRQADAALDAAKKRDAQLVAALAVAVQEEQKAERELAAVNQRIADEEQAVGQLAAAAYRSNGMGQLAVALDSASPDQFADRLVMVQTAMRAGDATLQDLATAKADARNTQAVLDAKREQVAAMREQARQLVIEKQKLSDQAEAAKKRVEQLVAARQAAMQAVQREKAAEQQRLAAAQAASKALAAKIRAAEIAAEKRLAAERARKAREARGSRGGGRSTYTGPSGSLLWPASGGMSQGAGFRINPATGSPSCHSGIDIAPGYGAPIHAADDGVVVATEYTAWDGYTTVVAHGGGLTTWYAHQNSFSVHVGQMVSRGEVIGYVGATGFATGPHLHFDVAVNGVAYDPMGWFGGPRRTVASMCPNGPSPVL